MIASLQPSELEVLWTIHAHEHNIISEPDLHAAWMRRYGRSSGLASFHNLMGRMRAKGAVLGANDEDEGTWIYSLTLEGRNELRERGAP